MSTPQDATGPMTGPMTDAEWRSAGEQLREIRASMLQVEVTMLQIEAMLAPIEARVTAALATAAPNAHTPNAPRPPTSPRAPVATATPPTATDAGDVFSDASTADGALPEPPPASANAEALRAYYCNRLGMTTNAWGKLWNVKGSVGDLKRIHAEIMRLYQNATRHAPSAPSQAPSGGFENPDGPASQEQLEQLQALVDALGIAWPNHGLTFGEAKSLIRQYSGRLQRKNGSTVPAEDRAEAALAAEGRAAMREPVAAGA